MRRIAIIGAVALVLGVAVWTTSDRVEAGPAKGPTPSQRLAALEHKMANLEKIVGVQLTDDAAIAAIVGEQQNARASDNVRHLVKVLLTIRLQNELYQVQHKGEYPDLGRGWDQLTNGTDSQGRIVRQWQSDQTVFGPYLRGRPVNPYTNKSRVITKREDVGPDAGWFFNRKTGDFKAIIPKAEAITHQLDADDVLTY